MNYHLTIALIIFATFIGYCNCNSDSAENTSKNGETGAEDGQGTMPELKPENEPIFMTLVVKALFDFPMCHRERKELKELKEKQKNFHAENGKCLITEDGLKLLKELKRPCKIELQMSQLNKHKSLKHDLEQLSNGETLSDGYMTDRIHRSVKAISGELVASILKGMEKGDLGVTDQTVMDMIPVCRDISPKQSEPLDTKKPAWQVKLIENRKGKGPPSAQIGGHNNSNQLGHENLAHSNPNGPKNPDGNGHAQKEGDNGQANVIDVKETDAAKGLFPGATLMNERLKADDKVPLPNADDSNLDHKTEGDNIFGHSKSLKIHKTNGTPFAQEEHQPIKKPQDQREPKELINSNSNAMPISGDLNSSHKPLGHPIDGQSSKSKTNEDIIEKDDVKKESGNNQKPTSIAITNPKVLDQSKIYSHLLVIEDCKRLFKQPKFTISSWLGRSSSTHGTFNWQLEATGENGFLAVFLHAKPPAGYKGNYRIEIDYLISLLDNNNDMHRVHEKYEQVCTDENNTGWGNPKMASLEKLLEDKTGLLHPKEATPEELLDEQNGIIRKVSIKLLAKFNIKSIVMDPIPNTIT